MRLYVNLYTILLILACLDFTAKWTHAQDPPEEDTSSSSSLTTMMTSETPPESTEEAKSKTDLDIIDFIFTLSSLSPNEVAKFNAAIFNMRSHCLPPNLCLTKTLTNDYVENWAKGILIFFWPCALSGIISLFLCCRTNRYPDE